MEEEKDKKNLADIFKKVINTGVSAAFMTEDAVKGIIQDLPLPKEMMNGLLQNAKNTRDEFILSVKTELKSYLDKIDVAKEIDRVLENYDLEVNAKIKFNKKKKSSRTKKTQSPDNER